MPPLLWSAQQFGSALDGLSLSVTNRQVLRAFLETPDLTLTAHGLAEAAQLPGGWTAANLRIGELARKFQPFLGELPDAGDGMPHWWRYVASGRWEGGRFHWTLRPGLLEALVARGWHRRELQAIDEPHFAQEIAEEGDPALYEGALRRVVVNAYERSREARRACIKRYGAVCRVCEVDMERVYGVYGRGYIEVHHLRPLSQIGVTYRVSAEHDLVPVCPNCHAMLHRTTPPLSVAELKQAMAQVTREA